MEPLRFPSHRHPIFVLGILQRSGTNYLTNLLLLHPDVRQPGTVSEDFFLSQADHLVAFADAVEQHWDPDWVEGIALDLGSGALLTHLGNGLVQFFERQYRAWLARAEAPVPQASPVRLVTTTPSVRNLDRFFDLFPGGVPLLIVRDGRAVVESGVRSFGWDYETGMRMWVAGARAILDFCAAPRNAGRHLLIRYEDLFRRNREAVTAILTFLELDPKRFDFDVAANLPVTGSSDLVQDREELRWELQPRRSDFAPLERAADWGDRLRCRFNWIAAREMRALGYDVDALPARVVWNRFLDKLYGLEIRLKDWPRFAEQVRRVRTRVLGVAARHRTPSRRP